VSAPAKDPLLILAPMRIEARALRRGARVAEVELTGIGARATTTAGRRAGRLDPDGPLAVAGFGGALRPGIQVGDVVVATEVRGTHGVLHLPAASAVAQALRSVGLTVHLGPILSTERFAWGKERSRLASSGALAVDMESYGVLSQTLAARTPAGRVAVGRTSQVGTPVNPIRAKGVPPDPAVRVRDWSRTRRCDHRTCVVRVVLDTPRGSSPGARIPFSWPWPYRALVRVASGLETWAAALRDRRVLVASPRSFCSGVNRAIESTEESLRVFGAPVYVLHEIVHNSHVVNSFRERGVVFVASVSDVPEGETVIFSAHGVGQAVRQEADSRRLRVIDATCPLVARVHAKARDFAQQGRHIVLIGKKGHDEIEGVMGEAPEYIHLVEGPDDVKHLDLDGHRDLAVLTQTTLIPHQAETLIRAINERFPTVLVPDALDVCYASQNRQEAVRRIAPRCDLMLVLGSRNSSNSKRLVEEAVRLGTPAHLVDDESEIDLAWLSEVSTVGLTAGASAPESLVERVVAFMEALGQVRVEEQVLALEDDGRVLNGAG
jgi:4-hydroxy-3-methylbut-2-en-1-yl diphosphate reductase